MLRKSHHPNHQDISNRIITQAHPEVPLEVSIQTASSSNIVQGGTLAKLDDTITYFSYPHLSVREKVVVDLSSSHTRSAMLLAESSLSLLVYRGPCIVPGVASPKGIGLSSGFAKSLKISLYFPLSPYSSILFTSARWVIAETGFVR